LGLGTDTDPTAGLMVSATSLVTSLAVVRIHDDHAEGFYDGEGVLEMLQILAPGDLSLESDSTNNVWVALAQFEV
jgi:hypothetical protein